MRIWLLAAFVIGTATGAHAETPEPALGAGLYAQYCASCHGVDAKGGTALSKIMTIATPDLTRIANRSGGWFPEVLVREIVDGRYQAHGQRQMPVWGSVLSHDEITSIVEYLYSLQEDGPK